MRLLLALILFGASRVSSQTFVIEGAVVIDGTGAPAKPGVKVVVRDGKIAAVGAGVATPPGAQIVNAAGQTLLPGLFDLHTHMPYSAVPGLWGDWGKNLKAYLLHGVTSAVDFGTYPETFEPMRRLLRSGAIDGPRMHLAARMTTPGGHGGEAGRGDFFSLEVTSPAEARAAMARLIPYQPDAIKVFTDGWRYGAAPDMSSMDQATLNEIVKQARPLGIEVMTHTVTLDRAKIAARAGVDVIAHGVGDKRLDEDFLATLAAKKTAYVSTLAVYESKAWPVAPILERFLEPAAVRIGSQMSNSAAPPSGPRRRRWANLTGNVKAALDAGGLVGSGTDAGVTGTLHGRSSLREIELMVTAGGFTPVQAIAAATGASARAIHVDAERGTIEPGKLADLVLVQGAPHERIEDLYKISGVWLNGKALDLDKLRRDIASEEVTPLPARMASPLIDDMEGERTSLDTLRVNATDPGHDNSKMLFQRVARNNRGMTAIAIQARMSEKAKPLAQLWLPLSRGGLEPVDASRFHGIQFDTRGEGDYKLILQRRAVRDGKFPEAGFRAGPAWSTVKITFDEIEGLGEAKDLLVVAFEISRAAGKHGWLELDNVRFF